MPRHPLFLNYNCLLSSARLPETGAETARMRMPGSQKGLPTQALILALVAVLVVPGIIFTGLLLTRYAESERARYVQDAREPCITLAMPRTRSS